MQVTLKHYLLAFGSFILSLGMQAGNVTLSKSLEKENLAVGTQMSINEFAFNNGVAPANLITAKRENVVRLVYSRDNQTDVLGSVFWTYTIEYKLIGTSGQQEPGTLEISYLPHGQNPTYEDLHVHTNGYENATLEITALYGTLSTDGGSSYTNITFPQFETSIPGNDIYLELLTQSERYYPLNTLITPELNWNGSNNTLFWSYVEGAEEYEIEYVHIDDQDNGFILVHAFGEQVLLDSLFQLAFS